MGNKSNHGSRAFHVNDATTFCPATLMCEPWNASSKTRCFHFTKMSLRSSRKYMFPLRLSCTFPFRHSNSRQHSLSRVLFRRFTTTSCSGCKSPVVVYLMIYEVAGSSATVKIPPLCCEFRVRMTVNSPDSTDPSLDEIFRCDTTPRHKPLLSPFVTR